MLFQTEKVINQTLLLPYGEVVLGKPWKSFGQERCLSIAGATAAGWFPRVKCRRRFNFSERKNEITLRKVQTRRKANTRVRARESKVIINNNNRMIIPQLSVRLELSEGCRESICLHLGFVRFLKIKYFMKFSNHFVVFIEKLVTFARSFRKNLEWNSSNYLSSKLPTVASVISLTIKPSNLINPKRNAFRSPFTTSTLSRLISRQ